MRDWIFPSITFLIFMYGIFFIGLYIHNYKNSNDLNIFSNSKNNSPAKTNINDFLKEISKSFK